MHPFLKLAFARAGLLFANYKSLKDSIADTFRGAVSGNFKRLGVAAMLEVVTSMMDGALVYAIGREEDRRDGDSVAEAPLRNESAQGRGETCGRTFARRCRLNRVALPQRRCFVAPTSRR